MRQSRTLTVEQRAHLSRRASLSSTRPRHAGSPHRDTSARPPIRSAARCSARGSLVVSMRGSGPAGSRAECRFRVQAGATGRRRVGGYAATRYPPTVTVTRHRRRPEAPVRGASALHALEGGVMSRASRNRVRGTARRTCARRGPRSRRRPHPDVPGSVRSRQGTRRPMCRSGWAARAAPWPRDLAALHRLEVRVARERDALDLQGVVQLVHALGQRDDFIAQSGRVGVPEGLRPTTPWTVVRR